MSASHDRKFFDTFMVVLGLLVAIGIGLIIVSRIISGNTAAQHKQDDPVFQQEVGGRIAAVARVAVAGEDNAALEAPAAAPAAGAADLSGEEVYNQACVACHGAGVAGAPKFGDAAAWAARIAQGPETLNTHALQGFQGKAGFMPPKGGRTDLSDQSVINAVEFMVAGSK